jgi:hypothetical protein
MAGVWLVKRRHRDTQPAPASAAQLTDEIAALAQAHREGPDAEIERRLLRLRHELGIRRLDEAPSDPVFASASGALPAGDPLPEFTRSEVDAGVLRAAILRDGCLLVRGLLDRLAAVEFAREIDRAYAARRGELHAGGYYEEFEPHERFGSVLWRTWIGEGGGLLAADSQRLCARMLELFGDAGVPELVERYLGEPPVISVHKTTLRRAEPSVGGAWHQDGFFMGPVRSLNLWVALSRCGDEAPGLDVLPRRLDRYLATGTEGAELNWTISGREVEQVAAAGTGIIRPVFEPGDALFFDELFLHRTGSDPTMPAPRFAIENWFFGASAFPADYAPIAV